MPYLTPESVPVDSVSRALLIPNSPLWLAIVSGALLELCNRSNWEQTPGGITPEAAASAAVEMFMSLQPGGANVPLITKLARTTKQVVPPSASHFGISWETAVYDDMLAWTVLNPVALIVPQSGLYYLAAQLSIDGDFQGRISTQITVNLNTAAPIAEDTVYSTTSDFNRRLNTSATTVHRLNAGDLIAAMVRVMDTADNAEILPEGPTALMAVKLD